jgi:hypothetical protein
VERLLIAAFSLLGGFILTRVADHVRAREQKRDVSKFIALSLLPIAKALKRNGSFFEQALPYGRDSLRGYFIAVSEVAPLTEVKDYEIRVRGDSKLKHRVLADLRITAEAIGNVTRWHQQTRNTIELSDDWYADRETYRLLMERAQHLVKQSLGALECLVPKDSKNEIRAFRNGVQ